MDVVWYTRGYLLHALCWPWPGYDDQAMGHRVREERQPLWEGRETEVRRLPRPKISEEGL